MTDARSHTRTIPSAFQKLDDRTDTIEHFMNVRDEQIFWQNQNILMARGIRRPVFHQSWNQQPSVNSTPGGAWAQGARIYSLYSPNETRNHLFMSDDVWLSPYVEKCQFKFWGHKLNLSEDDPGDPKIYPVFTLPGKEPEPDFDVSITVSATGNTSYGVEVPVPHSGKSKGTGPRLMRFTVFIETKISNANPVTASVNEALDHQSFEVSGSMSGGDDVFWFGATADPRTAFLMADGYATGTPGETFFTERPLPYAPANGDTCNGNKMAAVIFTSCSLYELEINDLEDRGGKLR